MEQTRGLFCACDPGVTRCQHNTGVTYCELVRCSKRVARQMTLTCDNQICVIHEAMDGYKNLKIN